jgi:glucuronoarabinoxylan endo-1,4-beta-xylanase
MSWLFLLSLFSATFSYDVTVRWNEVHQKMSGFGAGTGCPDCGGGNATQYGNSAMTLYNMPEPKRSEVLDLLFDTTKGIGLNCFRMGESWLLENAAGTWTWSPSAYEQGEIWVAKEARKRNATIKFWSAPWTPPLWMKTQQAMGGGELQTQYYQRYADYKSHFVRDMRDKEGITMMANSVQNEPQFGVASYGGCGYTGEQIRTFVRDYLGPTFKRDGLDKTTTIMIAESNYGETQFVTPTLNDAAALAYVGILGWHQYNDGTTPTTVAGAESWATEIAHGPWGGATTDLSWPEALWRHSQLFDAVVNKNAGSWSYYKFVSGGVSGLLYVYNNDYATGKGFWWIAHYSKFVRPGWVRIGTSVTIVGGGAKIAAFKDPASGRFAVVVGNEGTSKPGPAITVTCDGFTPRKVSAYLTPGEDQNVNMQGPTDVPIANGKFSYTVPNVSIVTLVGETQAVGAERALVAQMPARIYAMRVPSGLQVIMDHPAAGRAELLDSRGRMAAQWKIFAAREQTLRLSRPLEGGLHIIKVIPYGREGAVATFMN